MAFSLAADLLALKAELTNDPLSIGLTVLAADDEANANLLNEVRQTIQIDREAIPASELMAHIDRDEWGALSPADRSLVQVWATVGSVNPKSGNEIREGLMQMFGPTSETRANFASILTAAGSRIEQLFKAGMLSKGGNVTPSDIANARAAV